MFNTALFFFSNILLNPPYTDLLLTHTDDMLFLQLHTAQSQFFSTFTVLI